MKKTTIKTKPKTKPKMEVVEQRPILDSYEILPVANGFILRPCSSNTGYGLCTTYVFESATALADFIDARFKPTGERA